MATWVELSAKFSKFVREECEGPSKSSSGNISVTYMMDGCVSVEIGTYDVPQYPSHLDVGTFQSEQDALNVTEKTLNEMIDLVKCLKLQEEKYNNEEDGDTIPF